MCKIGLPSEWEKAQVWSSRENGAQSSCQSQQLQPHIPLETCLRIAPTIDAMFTQSCIRSAEVASLQARCCVACSHKPRMSRFATLSQAPTMSPAYSTSVDSCGGANNKNQGTYLSRASCEKKSRNAWLPDNNPHDVTWDVRVIVVVGGNVEELPRARLSGYMRRARFHC